METLSLVFAALMVVSIAPSCGSSGGRVSTDAADGAAEMVGACVLDEGNSDECSSRGLHRYLCPLDAGAGPTGCSQSGDVSSAGGVLVCCP
jgi:hypothetical protein